MHGKYSQFSFPYNFVIRPDSHQDSFANKKAPAMLQGLIMGRFGLFHPYFFSDAQH
jgi:hypothetical protein